MSNKKDVCLLEKDGHGIPPVLFTSVYKNVNYNDQIFTIGAPSDIFPTRVDGYVTEIVGENNIIDLKKGMLITSLPVYSGFSGSPIFLKGSNIVIGMVIAVHKNYSHICMATSSDDLLEFFSNE